MTTMLNVGGHSYMNGVPVDQLRGLIDAATRRPTAASSRWRVASTWRGRLRSTGRIDGFEIGGRRARRPMAVEADAPQELGGTDNYASPQELLLAALNACLTAQFAALCALEEVEIYRLEIATEADLDLRCGLGVEAEAPCGFTGLSTTITVRGPAADEDYRRIFARTLATSPGLHSLTQPVQVGCDLVVA